MTPLHLFWYLVAAGAGLFVAGCLGLLFFCLVACVVGGPGKR